MTKARYIEFKLDETSKNRLKVLTEKLFGGSYRNIYCDHVTLAYGPEQVAAFDESLIGVKDRFEAWNVVYDEKGAALELDRKELSRLGVNNDRPHVTMACAEDVRPVYSNELIARYYSGSLSVKSVQLNESFVVSGFVHEVR